MIKAKPKGEYPGNNDEQIHELKFDFDLGEKDNMIYRLVKRLDTYLFNNVIAKREPDFKIPYDDTNTYMERYYLIPHNKIFNIYLHQFYRPDPDYTLHDHPWFSVSLILFSSYTEQTIKYGGIAHFKDFKICDLHFMSPWHTHRITKILGGTCRTLFITGPVLRKWGFHNSVMGWLDNKTYKDRLKNVGKDF